MAAGNAQRDIVVLKEQEIFDVSDAEVEEFAEWIGLDLEFERDLLDLARTGLLAKLPDGWRACASRARPDELFYWHAASRTSTWEHPNDAIYRERMKEARAQRRCRVVTLSVSVEEKVVAAINMAGDVVAMLEIGHGGFDEIDRQLRQQLDRSGTALYFAKPDGTLIGHSSLMQRAWDVLS